MGVCDSIVEKVTQLPLSRFSHPGDRDVLIAVAWALDDRVAQWYANTGNVPPLIICAVASNIGRDEISVAHALKRLVADGYLIAHRSDHFPTRYTVAPWLVEVAL
jgi:hypothetical protein